MFARIVLPVCFALFSSTVMSQTIEFVVDNQAYPAELNGNDAAKSLVSQLPITLVFDNFGSLERIATPPKSLSLGSAPQECDPVRGTISYYIPWGNLAIFKGSFRHSPDLVPLGEMSEEALKAVETSGKKPVTIRLAK